MNFTTIQQIIFHPLQAFRGFIHRRSPHNKLGTFTGAYLPSFLQMVGVILFMRLGWITGNVGITNINIIIAIASSLMLITCFSMTSIVTNMKMEGGGAYYIISRSLGLELGSALGIMLCVAQITSIALSTSGFAASIGLFFPEIPTTYVEISTIIGLMTITFISVKLASKLQITIFTILTLAVISAFTGKISNVPPEILAKSAPPTLSFWMAFALFFPATTGIEAGMAMSGDIKKPSRSLPIGTIGAVITAYILYMSLSHHLWNNIPRSTLLGEPMVAYYFSSIGMLIVFGIWGATLSSALGSMLGAPRTLQAIAKDGILPKFLAKGFGKSNEPRIALVVIFLLATLLTVFTVINQLIPILTMVCLLTYGLINFIAFFESLLNNPSWRPSFKTHWLLGLIGGVGCFMTMFMINSGASFIVWAVMGLIFFITTRRNLQGNWDDIRYGMFLLISRFSIHLIGKIGKNPKNWRPNILTLAVSPISKQNLVYFAHALTQGRSFLTFSVTVSEHLASQERLLSMKKTLEDYLHQRHIPCFIHVKSASNPYQGMISMIKSHGIGELQPNTILLHQADTKNFSADFSSLILNSYRMHKNTLILRDNDDGTEGTFIQPSRKKNKKIVDIWWTGETKNSKDFELSLCLLHILQNSKVWKDSIITLKAVAPNASAKKRIKEYFKAHFYETRLSSYQVKIYVESQNNELEHIAEHSPDSDLVFIGLVPPSTKDTVESYNEYYSSVVKLTANTRNAIYVLAGEKIKFEDIFT
ncbi:MAG: amino acid permease [Chlamydiota bacterium]